MEFVKAFAPPILDSFVSSAKLAKNSVTIISPFITTFVVKSLVRSLPGNELSIRVCSRFNSQTFNQRSSDFAALEILSKWNQLWDVTFFRLPRLHAKISLFDGLCIISSANLTQGGLRTNYEFGLTLSNASAVSELSSEIEKIISASSQVQLHEIAEYAAQATGSIVPEDIDVTAVEPVSEGTEDAEPEESSSLTQYDLDLIKKFDRELESRLTLDAMETPFGRPSFIDQLGPNRWEGEDHVELTRAASNDISQAEEYLRQFIERNRFDKDSQPIFRQLFMHTSFNHKFNIENFSPGIQSGLESLEALGSSFVKLFLFHHSFRGNYRWIEALRYYEIWARQSLIEIEPNSILESIGANWLIHFTDIMPDWRRRHFLKIVGITFRFSTKQGWGLLSQFIDPVELLAQGAFRSADAKTALQETLQEQGVMPTYKEVKREGEEHSLTFGYEAHALGCVGKGSGRSKKLAMQEAAGDLLNELQAKKLVSIDMRVQERRPATGIQPYVISKERLTRLNRARSLFDLHAPDALIDCALTTVNERAWSRETRSNEKLALVGAMVVEIVQKLSEFEARFSSGADPAVIVQVSNQLLEEGFIATFPEFGDFLGKFYAEESDKNRQSVVDAIVGLIWLTEGEKSIAIVQSIIKSVWDKATEGEPTAALQ